MLVSSGHVAADVLRDNHPARQDLRALCQARDLEGLPQDLVCIIPLAIDLKQKRPFTLNDA
jgi:hypothetical protein